MTSQPGLGRAEACANIALAKYWGKSERGGNLTAVPSLSLTLDALRTRTEVRLEPSAELDQVTLGGKVLAADESTRVVALLERLRQLAGSSSRAVVVSHNDFPTAAGLASSASGFAALATAASQAYGLELTAAQLSSQARQGSASAARSLFSGFAALGAEADEAEAIAGPEHWSVAMVVAVVAAGKKSISSTAGMVQTARTCPYYPAWVTASPALYARVERGVLERDFEQVADAMEESTRLMHATMMTSVPPVLYFRGPTIELMHEVAVRRARGEPVAYTMDAGPNVKILTEQTALPQLLGWLEQVEGISQVIVCRPGPAAAWLSAEGSLTEAARVREVA